MPSRPVAGDEVRVILKAEAGSAGIAIHVRWKSGELEFLGKTDPGGELRWTPEQSGAGELSAASGGMRYLLPVEVLAPRSFLAGVLPWLLLFVACALLLIRRARRRGRR
ncbi:MAG: hypothetical protein ACE5F1_22310 [Planctomycetota bacterium]